MSHSKIITRQSIFILIAEIIFLEVLVNIIGYAVKFPIINGWTESLSIYTGITVLIQSLNILFIILIVLRWASTEYRIENESLVMKKGIVSIVEKMYTVDSIETVEVEQGLLGRLFNFGTLRLYSPLFSYPLYIWAVPDVHRFAEVIKAHIPKNSAVTIRAK